MSRHSSFVGSASPLIAVACVVDKTVLDLKRAVRGRSYREIFTYGRGDWQSYPGDINDSMLKWA